MLYKIENETVRSRKPFNEMKLAVEALFADMNKVESLTGAVIESFYTRYLEDFRPLVLKESDVRAATGVFGFAYRDAMSHVDFYKDLVIKWTTFKSAVDAANAQLSIPEDRLALRFIHRYNANTHRWFLTVQICKIDGPPLMDTNDTRRHETYNLIPQDKYFDIKDDQTNTTTTVLTELGDDVMSRYGKDYFSNILYGAKKVSEKVNVHSCTFSWSEISKLYSTNITADRDDDNSFEIAFASASNSEVLPSPNTYVEYPHCMLLYMNYNGVPCLNDSCIILGNFENKAGNYNTICPKRCGVYLWQADLPRPTSA